MKLETVRNDHFWKACVGVKKMKPMKNSDSMRYTFKFIPRSKVEGHVLMHFPSIFKCPTSNLYMASNLYSPDGIPLQDSQTPLVELLKKFYVKA